MAWKIVEGDPFADELDFEDLKKKREAAEPKPPASTSDLLKYGEAYSPFQAFGQTVESPESALKAPTPKRPEGFSALADPQQYAEVAKGVPQGAVSFVGTTLQGAGAVPATAQANVQKNAQARIAMLDRLDRGEAPTPKRFGDLTSMASLSDDYGYRSLSPEQRAAERQKLQGQLSSYKPTPLAEQPLYKAGQSVQDYAKTILPAAPGYEDAFGRQIGEGLGSLIAGLPFGVAGRIPGTIFFGAGGMGEAGTRAIAYDQAEKRAGRPGLTQDQINTAALYGVGPGTTDMLPVEALLGRLHVPTPGRKALAQAIGRIGGQAFIEGMQEGGQQFLQNLIAKGIYKPDQALGEQVRENAEVGGAVGAAAEAAKEVGGSLWQRLLGRRGHAGGARPDAGAGASDPLAQPLTPAPGGEGVTISRPEPIDVTFEDLIPPERRLPRPEEPAPQAGLEPPPLPSPAPQAAPQVLPAAQAVEAAPVPPERIQNFWNVTRALDANLQGDFGRAVTEWVGGPHDAIDRGYEGGLMAPERLEKLPDAQLDSMALPVRNAMRAMFGDTITVYRGEGEGEPSTGRQGKLASYTTDPAVAQRFAGANREVPLISEPEIVRAEQELAQTGKTTLGNYSFQFNPQYGGYIDLYDKDGQHITDTPGPRAMADQQNAYAREQNAKRGSALKKVRAVQIPVDAVVWATDRFGQKEIIARTGYEVRDEFGGDTNAVTTRVAPSAQTEAMGAPESLPMPSGSFSTQDVLYALGAPQGSRDDLGYTSKAVDAANALQRKSGPSAGFLNDLTKAGVTKNELQATGLDKFLAERPNVTKQEIVDFLAQNRVGLKETRYGGLDPNDLPSDLLETLREEEVNSLMDGDAYSVWFDEDEGRWTYGLYGEPSHEYGGGQVLFDSEEDARTELREMLESEVRNIPDRDLLERHRPELARQTADVEGGAAKWRDYSLDPDNPTYRENVLHIPLKREAQEALDAEERRLNRKYWDERRVHWTAAATPEERAHMQALEAAAKKEVSDSRAGSYKSGHWDERNIVAHTRTALFQDTQGRQVFNIDELQSDWGQKIREGGTRDEEKIADLKRRHAEIRPALSSAIEEAKSALSAVDHLGFDNWNQASRAVRQHPDWRQRWDVSEEEAAPIQRYVDLVKQESLIDAEIRTAEAPAPSHPLVNTTDQWVTTAMRRLIQQAADSGADGISITPAKVQNERFSLSRHIRALRYVPEIGALQGEQLTGGWISLSPDGKEVAPEQLPGIVGKEMSQKLLAAPRQAMGGGSPYDAHTLTTGDLEIGGEGMRATYDKLYPEVLGKLLRKLDPSIKAEKTRYNLPYKHEITRRNLYRVDPELDFTYFPLTDKAKQKLADEGQPMFALGGASDVTKTPEFKRWFGDSKVVDGQGNPLVVYHGTLGEFDRFGHKQASPESNMGAGFYFTSHPEDASENYARAEGPDIGQRLQLAKERIANEEDEDGNYRDYTEVSDDEARARFGYSHEGTVIPTYLRIEKPFVLGLGDQKETRLDYELEYNDPDDEESDYQPTGKLVEFIEALRDVAVSYDDVSGLDEGLAALEERGFDGSLSASEVLNILRDSEALIYASDPETGDIVSADIIRQALERIGFDGIIDQTVTDKFGRGTRMRGMDEDTTHYIAFRPNQIKSAIGNRGSFDPNDDRIAYATGKSAAEVKRHIGAFVKMGRAINVPFADSALAAAKPYSASIPSDTQVAALTRIEPMKGGMARAVFKTSTGETVTGLEAPWETIASIRAFFRPGNQGAQGRIFLIRFAESSGPSPRLGGEIRHESVHALRRGGAFPGEVWSRLLGHAKKLRILESDLRTYLQAIDDPDYRHVEPGLTIIDEYLHSYKGLPDLLERIDQEYVAHMAELYSHGQLLPQELGDVQADLDDIFSGKYSTVRRQNPASPAASAAPQSAFAGPWAQTAKQNPLIQAQKLEERGVDPETIWKRTGWFKGADDRWKFEIDDSLASIKFDDKIISGGVGNFRTTLGAFLDHPALFKAYPFLRGLPVFLTTHMIPGEAGHKGVSDGESREGMPPAWVTVGVKGYEPQDRQRVLSALLHEVQHDIQDIENFAAGGNMKGYASGFINRLFDKQLTEFDQRLIQSDRVRSDYRDWMTFAKNAALKPDDQELRDGLTYFTGRLSQSVAFEAYQRLAGEVESREVENRRHLTAAERREEFPMPVAKDEQRVKMSWDDARYADDMLALGGARAIGAPKGAFAIAERRETQGRNPDQIWQELGVTRGPENKWRWEIDDSAAKIIGLDKVFEKPSPSLMQRLMGRAVKSGNVKTAINVPLLNVLSHPKLYTAYPFLRQMRVDLAYGPDAPTEGQMRSRNTESGGKVYKPIKASAPDAETLKSVLLHEIQHYIQQREGFATGSDIPKRPDYQRSRVSDDAQATALYDPARDTRGDDIRYWGTRSIVTPTIPERHAIDIMNTFGELDAAKARNAPQSEISELEDRLRGHGILLEDAMLVRPEDYTRSAGEAEAREVETRIGMTPTERRATRPLADLPKDAIVGQNTQTRDYAKAYDAVMERAKIWKQIQDQWKTAEPIGAGVSVVRPSENFLAYAKEPGNPLMVFDLYPELGNAVPEKYLSEALAALSYAEQRKAVDAIMKDLRSRNMQPTLDRSASDDAFVFWARYDPRMVAFDPRLYAREVEELAKAEYGEDATVSYDAFYNVYKVTSPEMKLAAQKAAIDADKLDKQADKFVAQMHKKYGDTYYDKMTPEENARMNEFRVKFEELVQASEQDWVEFDDSAIFEGRAAHWRKQEIPGGVDPGIYKDLIIDEQLDRWGKLPRPGDDVDFSDLLPA